MKPKELKMFTLVKVHFESQEDLDSFSELIKQRIAPQTRSIWYPEMTMEKYTKRRYGK